MSYPKEYKYTKEHEWIHPKGKTALVGITNFAQESLGDIVHVDLPKIGAQLQAGSAFGAVESVKAASDLFAPASGKVVAVNQNLDKAPEAVNEDAHKAWMLEVELKDAKELDALMSAEEYEAFIAEEKPH